MKLLQITFLAGWLVVLGACAHQQQNMQAPQLSAALDLRGKTIDQVKTALGEPSDHDGEVRYYYFLQEESSHHPNPQPKLYVFVFSNRKLLKVELAAGTQ